jgi:hypothetical protein
MLPACRRKRDASRPATENSSSTIRKRLQVVLAAPGYDVLENVKMLGAIPELARVTHAFGLAKERCGHRPAQLSSHIGPITRKDGPK